MSKWIVTVALEHHNGRIEVVTIEDKSLELITDALDLVPVGSYTILAAKGERLPMKEVAA